MFKKTIGALLFLVLGAGLSRAQDAVPPDETTLRTPPSRHTLAPAKRVVRPKLNLKKSSQVKTAPAKNKDGFYPLDPTPAPKNKPTRLLDTKGEPITPRVKLQSKKYSTLYQDPTP